MSPPQACLAFIDSIDFLDGYIVGVTSQKELSELFIERRDLSRMSFDKFAVNDIELIDPRKWI